MVLHVFGEQCRCGLMVLHVLMQCLALSVLHLCTYVGEVTGIYMKFSSLVCSYVCLFAIPAKPTAQYSTKLLGIMKYSSGSVLR